MVETRLIDGKAFAARLRERVAEGVASLQNTTGVTPGLAVVLVGHDPASEVYVRNKGAATIAAGMRSFDHRLPADTTQETLLNLIQALNTDPQVHGILVQLPLPSQIDSSVIIQAIDPDKDVDGFHPINTGRLAQGLPGLVPCTPLGCLMLLKDELGSLSGKHAIVIGRSNIVGRPMSQLLLSADCTVTIAHSRTANLPEEVRRGDIVVAAVGRPEMVRGSWLKPGAVVIDVGINRVPANEPSKTKLVGDVNFAEAQGIAGAITPVPGGVGPMTIACLLFNTLTAASRTAGVPNPVSIAP